MTTVRARVKSMVGDAIDVDTARAFADSEGDAGARRMRVLLPLMIAVHWAHVLVYRVSDAERATLEPTVALWREGITITHVVTALVALPLALIAWRGGRRLARHTAPIAAIVYLMHGALCTGIDQLVIKNVNAYTGYAFGAAIIAVMLPRQIVTAYAVGIVTAVAAIHGLATDVNTATSATLTVLSSSAVGVALGLILHFARRRDFTQKQTIERQQRELTALNSALEKRVQDQVAEIVKRADEVHALNAQLQARVQDRSNELSTALRRLAMRRHVDGRLQKGTVLGERFEIDAWLGAGGMGAVYSGLDRASGARVAIKVVQAESARQLDELQRFLREAHTAATVAHPGVVRALFVDISSDGVFFQVHELVDGETLERFIERNHTIAEPLAARIGAALCDALAAAHAAGVVHRDVKPSNAMLTSEEPGLKLLDFGIATTANDEHAGDGFVIGTPAFMAPEQKAGDDVDGRADIYAVGVILFRMLAGALPLDEKTTPARASTGEALRSFSLAGRADPALARIVATCLERERDQRPSATALASELRAFADARGAPSLVSTERDRTIRQ
ncbi:MAG TPA: protein kinase [Myxococcota bacterium]|jgi:serine/threonine-protein kinase